jgi:predicted phage terminase large subunit-like protein
MNKSMNYSLEEQKQIIQAGKSNLIDFSIITNPKYQSNWHHELIADKLERVERGECKRLMIFMPPRHGKSQLASIDFPAWYLGRNPDKEIITASYSGDLATDFGSKTRDKVNDEVYRLMFDVRLKSDEQSKSKWRTSKGGSYTSTGIGGPLTGRGANILLIDDPVKNREEADSETMRDKVWDWYISTAYTRLEKDGAVILIMTRWNLDDLAGRLLEAQDTGDEWEILNLSAIAEEDEEWRKKGEPLWPEKYDLEALKSIKNTIGIYDWACLYQQNPVPSDRQEFKREWFKYWNENDRLTIDSLDVYAMVDLAISEKEFADNTSIQVIGKAKGNPNIYKLEDLTGQLDPGQTIDYLFNLKTKYGHRFMKVGIESVGYQKSLMWYLNEAMKQKEIYFDVVELKAKGEKETRIRGLVPMYKNGMIFHNVNDRGYENELLLFPFGKHDDRIDSMAYLQQILENTKTGPGVSVYTPNWAKIR